METNSRIGTTEAAEIVGCSPRRIQKMITDGILSAERDSSKKYWIEMSEFYRVFPNELSRKNSGVSESDNFAHITQQVDYLTKQNDFLMGQVEFLQRQLEAAANERKVWLDNQQKLLPSRKKFLGIF